MEAVGTSKKPSRPRTFSIKPTPLMTPTEDDPQVIATRKRWEEMQRKEKSTKEN
jgi:hypothetical protein